MNLRNRWEPILPHLRNGYSLHVDDGSRVGALRFRDEAGVFRRAAEPGRRTAPPLLELRHLMKASRAVETETETAGRALGLANRDLESFADAFEHAERSAAQNHSA